MLSFEKVLNIFAEYLRQDLLYKVVQTSHGYADGVGAKQKPVISPENFFSCNVIRENNKNQNI